MRIPRVAFASMTLSALFASAPSAAQAPAAPSAPAAPAAPQAPRTAPAPTVGALGIGDRAPAFAPETWVKGDAFDAFEPGKVYVVEFWATWCIPCVAEIPHLTKLQAAHPEITIVGVAASERPPKPGQEDVRLPKLRDFVSAKGDAMGYRVAYTPVRDLPNAWMTAAGRNTIPTSFIVGKDGVIEWIGSPRDIDTPLEQVLAGSWDRVAAAEAYRESEQKMNVERQRAAARAQAIAKARAAEDWDGLIKIYDEVAKSNPKSPQPRIEQFKILAGKANRPDAATKVGNELVKQFNDEPGVLNEVAWFIADDRSVQSRDLDLALRAAERANELTEGDDPQILDTLARVWWEKGDRANAVKFQKLAVASLPEGDAPIARQIRETLERYEGKTAAR